MPDDHPGFDHWNPRDPDHPFPVGDFELKWGTEDGAKGEVDLTLPQKQPARATVAESYIGVIRSAQLWCAIECVNDLAGNLVCQAVLRGRHVHWYPGHGESEGGPVQEIRLSMADMRNWGGREALAAHGPHCDLFCVDWTVRESKVHFEIMVMHFGMTVQGFLDMRERNNREAERLPLRPPEFVPLPHPGTPTPKPKPPDPGPDGAMVPERPGGLFGGLVALVKRLVRAVFG